MTDLDVMKRSVTADIDLDVLSPEGVLPDDDPRTLVTLG